MLTLAKCACQRTGTMPATPDNRESAHTSTGSELREPPTANDICRALEEAAPFQSSSLPAWSGSKVASMPRLSAGREPQVLRNSCRRPPAARPCGSVDPMELLRHSAAYSRELLNRFGNLGLAAAAYNAGPARVSAWLNKPPPFAWRNAQLCGSCDRLVGRRHPARQSDPCAPSRETAHCHLHTAGIQLAAHLF